jgi:hypothetical protein
LSLFALALLFSPRGVPARVAVACDPFDPFDAALGAPLRGTARSPPPLLAPLRLPPRLLLPPLLLPLLLLPLVRCCGSAIIGAERSALLKEGDAAAPADGDALTDELPPLTAEVLPPAATAPPPPAATAPPPPPPDDGRSTAVGRSAAGEPPSRGLCPARAGRATNPKTAARTPDFKLNRFICAPPRKSRDAVRDCATDLPQNASSI